MIPISWWPKGHQFPLQKALDHAEAEADHTLIQLDRALARGGDHNEIASLSKAATRARHAYYAALNADLAL
ncbi:hypothetical protein [Labrenzia sp. DG1229]|uniref:hypothetical protein n=1 Tax=Labrenzia sp. DG1229 TaxID=681847 RepID=UPI00048CF291|nr:hypothetical protein [Labrenzia sp. DG1229]